MAHNFFIGDLGFHKVINDEHPYERATAPFRKEQFDAAPTVGDQSLAGWWTRGQLSFHKGAGTKYYEVLDGEDILNRFHDGHDITPFTPGKLGCAPAYSEFFAPGTVSTVGGAAATGTIVAAITTGGVAYGIEGSTPTVKAAGSGSYEQLCAGPHNFYATTSGNTIERLSNGATGATMPDAVLYTHTTGFRSISYAKNRLWVSDDLGDVYALAVTPSGTLPVAIGSADKVFSLTDGVSTAGLFVDTPGDVYTFSREAVYRVALDTDGSVPTLAAPIVAAVTPNGEAIYALAYYLGHLVIFTEKGVRVAAIQGNGSLVYGPRFIDWEQTGQLPAVAGSYVYALGKTDGVWALYQIDLSVETGDLTFAYVKSTTGSPLPSNNYSFLLTVGDRVLHGASSSPLYVQSASTLTSGEVTTGFHRFGTLDEKHFHSVVVRTDGAGGSVDVYRIDSEDDPTGTLLGSVSAGESTVLPLAVSTPQEKIALRFTLTPAGSAGPELLGYQIKALPSPKRQRLIRVPLMMFDTERGPTGRAIGAEKSAWTRYTALESLEESDALVTYEDGDTGETGTGFIESVELIQRNGSKGVSRSNGFGGVVSVTLRKVS